MSFSLDPGGTSVINCLERDSYQSISDIVSRTGLNWALVYEILVHLDEEGAVDRHRDNEGRVMWRRK